MPPLIYDDLVLIGPAGAESAAKGWVGAFRLSDGRLVWKFNTIPEPGDPAAKTWGGDANVLKYGGGTVWTPMSFDVQNELLQVPVANPAPDFYDKDRPGDNLYTSSIVALNVRTGKLAWYYRRCRTTCGTLTHLMSRRCSRRRSAVKPQVHCADR
jgi:alcohol dehydrogenase (cytochrome c)